MSWYYVDLAGATKGPLSVTELKLLYGSEIKDGTFVWNGTSVAQWKALREVVDLLEQLKPLPKKNSQSNKNKNKRKTRKPTRKNKKKRNDNAGAQQEKKSIKSKLNKISSQSKKTKKEKKKLLRSKKKNNSAAHNDEMAIMKEEYEQKLMSEDDEGDNTPFDGTAWIYDSKNDKMTQNCVVKTKKCINLVPLEFRPEDNENGNGKNDEKEPVSKRVRGGKGLEEARFSCGVLEIPPESMKHTEISYFTEQFFVHQCERKQLLFQLGEDEFLLSRGNMFYVPPENEYSLKNLSKTHPVKLIFTLIKSENKMDDDTQTQMDIMKEEYEQKLNEMTQKFNALKQEKEALESKSQANADTHEVENLKKEISAENKCKMAFRYWLCDIANLRQYLTSFEKADSADIRYIEFFDEDTIKNEVGIKHPIHFKFLMKKVNEFKHEQQAFQNKLEMNEITKSLKSKFETNGILTMDLLQRQIKTKQDLIKVLQTKKSVNVIWSTLFNQQQQQKQVHYEKEGPGFDQDTAYI